MRIRSRGRRGELSGSKGVAWRKGRAGLGQSEKGEPVAGCSCEGEECLAGSEGLVIREAWFSQGAAGTRQE